MPPALASMALLAEATSIDAVTRSNAMGSDPAVRGKTLKCPIRTPWVVTSSPDDGRQPLAEPRWRIIGP